MWWLLLNFMDCPKPTRFENVVRRGTIPFRAILAIPVAILFVLMCLFSLCMLPNRDNLRDIINAWKEIGKFISKGVE
jgi:hypothetical protein